MQGEGAGVSTGRSTRSSSGEGALPPTLARPAPPPGFPRSIGQRSDRYGDDALEYRDGASSDDVNERRSLRDGPGRVAPRRGRRRWRLWLVGTVGGLALIVVVAVAIAAAVAPDARRSEADGPPPSSPDEVPAGSTPSSKVLTRDDPDPPRGPIVRLTVGRGAGGAVVYRRADATGPRPTTIFLHGWGIRSSEAYEPWLRHLAANGETVIFPRYQGSNHGRPDQALDRALMGIRRALRLAPVADGSLVVAGHSAGAALAADYAAGAARRRLPAAAAVFAVFPGRAILGFPAGIPAVDAGRIPGGTRLLVMAGTRDTVVGVAPARTLLASASRVPRQRKAIVILDQRGVADHYAPTRSGRAIRRTFWRRLDRLTVTARRRAG